MNLRQFFSFESFVTPVIIQAVFWIGLIVTILMGAGMISSGLVGGAEGTPFLFLGLAYILFGPIVVRVYCELLIVIFRLNETVTEIHRDLRRRQTAIEPRPDAQD